MRNRIIQKNIRKVGNEPGTVGRTKKDVGNMKTKKEIVEVINKRSRLGRNHIVTYNEAWLDALEWVLGQKMVLKPVPNDGLPVRRWLFTDAVQLVNCPKCGASKGYYCHTPKYAKVWPPHMERTELVCKQEGKEVYQL